MVLASESRLLRNQRLSAGFGSYSRAPHREQNAASGAELDPHCGHRIGFSFPGAGLFARLHRIFDEEIDARLRGRDAGEPKKNDFLDLLLDAAEDDDNTAGLDRDTLRSLFTVIRRNFLLATTIVYSLNFFLFILCARL